jgi:hypothetical protein
MGVAGARLMGAGSVCGGLVSVTPSGQGAHTTSPESGSIKGGTAGVGPTGMVSVATSPFDGVTGGSGNARSFDAVT